MPKNEYFCPHCQEMIPEDRWPLHSKGAWSDREERLWDALNGALDYIGDGSPDDTYASMMAESRMALRDMYEVPKEGNKCRGCEARWGYRVGDGGREGPLSIYHRNGCRFGTPLAPAATQERAS